MTSTRRFRGALESVSAARRFARESVAGRAGDAVDAVELMVSELASNCVEHADTDFEVSIDVSESEVRVSARDRGRGQPVPRSPTLREPRGRGLRIVEALSDDWGVIASASESTVWFTLHLHLAAPNSEMATAARGKRSAPRSRGSSVGSRSGFESRRSSPNASPPRAERTCSRSAAAASAASCGSSSGGSTRVRARPLSRRRASAGRAGHPDP